MIRNFKNVSASPIVLGDFMGMQVAAGEGFDGLAFGEQALRDSLSIKMALYNGEFSLSDGVTVFTNQSAVDLIMGYATQVTRDGKQIITSSDRPKDHYRCFSGCSDDIVNGKRGLGDPLLYDVAPNTEVSKEVHFIDDIYLRDGKLSCRDASLGSFLDSDIVCPTGVPYPVKGDGNLDLVGAAFVPNASGTGMYRLATAPTVIFKFASRIYLLGDTPWEFDSPEPFLMGKPYYIRLTIFNAATDKNLQATISMGYYRKETL